MYVIKQLPEDFNVVEKSTLNLQKQGAYGIFLLEKMNYTTERAVQQIADALHILRKAIGYAGNKDKNAITQQYISIKGKGKNAEMLRLKDLKLTFKGFSNVPLSLGDLNENHFAITIRNLTLLEAKKLLNNNMVETRVADQGVGIPENAIDKLFTKFYRSHRTRTSHRGTGLGLYMSKAIVEAHGGSIWVESKAGEGSTFGFLLPIYDKLNPGHVALEQNNKIIRGIHGWIKNHSLYRG